MQPITAVPVVTDRADVGAPVPAKAGEVAAVDAIVLILGDLGPCDQPDNRTNSMRSVIQNDNHFSRKPRLNMKWRQKSYATWLNTDASRP